MESTRLQIVTVGVALGLLALSSSGQAQMTRRMSVDPKGNEVIGNNLWMDISADNTLVVFSSDASTLVAGDTNGLHDIFVHDRVTGDNTRISVATGGAESDDGSFMPQFSGDGNLVVFQSWATNLVPSDTNGQPDVFVHDRAAGTTTRVSVTNGGAQLADGGRRPRISANGQYVTYLRDPNLNNKFRVIRRDLVAGTNLRVDVSSSGTPADLEVAFEPVAPISADGQIVAFVSFAGNLVPGMTGGMSNVFVRDMAGGTTELISLGYLGDPAGGAEVGVTHSIDLSADGKQVFFTSWASNLVPGDTNGWRDVFVHDRTTGQTQRVNVGPSGEEDMGGAGSFAGIGSLSADGTIVSFITAGALTPDDTDTVQDAYVRDLESGSLRRITQTIDGAACDDLNENCTLSPDGRYTLIQSWASNLVHGDTNGWRDVFLHGPELELRATPEAATVGDTLELLTFGGASGSPALLFVSAVDGIPLLVNTGVSSLLDAGGAWSLSAVVPNDPTLSAGVDVRFRVLALGASGKIVGTNDATVMFQ